MTATKSLRLLSRYVAPPNALLTSAVYCFTCILASAALNSGSTPASSQISGRRTMTTEAELYRPYPGVRCDIADLFHVEQSIEHHLGITCTGMATYRPDLHERRNHLWRAMWT